MIDLLYRLISYMLWPLLLPWLLLRQRSRQHTMARWKERLGKPTLSHPGGALVWFHAASLGETRSLFPLIGHILEQNQHLHILLTTVTSGAAECAQKQKTDPHYQRLIHQYIPYDHPLFVSRFLSFWKPSTGIFVESELWPNLIRCAAQRKIRLALINARISKRSFQRWRNLFSRRFIRLLLAHFDLICAQNQTSAQRLLGLGADQVKMPGNLKFHAPSLGVDKEALAILNQACNTRVLWLAASTHAGEETMVAAAHERIKAQFPTVLSVCVPRHPWRGDEIAATLRKQSLHVSQRSKKDPIKHDTDIYLADSFGELGLFYRLCPFSLLGGSLIQHGGQNPLEAARLHSVVLHGPHTDNFAEIFAFLHRQNACIPVKDANGLADQLLHLFRHPHDADQLRKQAAAVAASFEAVHLYTYDLLRRLWEAPHA